jgi:hypothetical protein
MIVDFFLFMRNKRKAKTNKNQNRMLGRTWEKDSENALAKKKKKNWNARTYIFRHGKRRETLAASQRHGKKRKRWDAANARTALN